ncbi:trehalase domain-containing protein [Ditylenchus destructor]|nr:trehalase domain-containing protein [Ditylenchus destructor]
MASHMFDMAKQMMRNLALMVDNFGFIPNGGRIYYLRRSQPPLLSPMVYEYYESNHTIRHDDDFLREMLPTLEKELTFWDEHRTVTYMDPETKLPYVAYRYCADSNVPRPESFKEDMAASAGMPEEEQAFFYKVSGNISRCTFKLHF